MITNGFVIVTSNQSIGVATYKNAMELDYWIRNNLTPTYEDCYQLTQENIKTLLDHMLNVVAMYDKLCRDDKYYKNSDIVNLLKIFISMYELNAEGAFIIEFWRTEYNESKPV